MNYTSTKNFTLKIFIFTTVIQLIYINSGICASSEYSHHHNLTTVELVLHSQSTDNTNSSNQLSLFNQTVKQYQIYDYETPVTNRFPVIVTLHSLDSQFKASQQILCPGQFILSILQKSHIWHLSTDDDPPHIYFC